MKEFIEEVNEELQWERIINFLKKHGNFLIGGVLLFFIGLSGWIYWDYTQTQKMVKTAGRYEEALILAEKDEIEKSIQLLGQLSADTKNGYHLLAELKIIGLRPDQVAQNAEIYKKLATDPKLEKNFQELAAVLGCLEEIDTAKPVELAERLKPIAENVTSPWKASAAELLGLLLVKAGNISRAIEVYKNLSEDNAATPGIRARSSAMVDYLKK